MSKCPPGVICIENMTIIFLILIILVTGYLVYIFIIKGSANEYTFNVSNVSNGQQRNGLYPRPGYTFSNIEE